MDLTPANLNKFFLGYSVLFQQAYQTSPVYWPQVASLITSSTEQELYGWMALSERMREWVGPRVVHNVEGRVYSLINKDFELTKSVPRNKLMDDTYGVYSYLPVSMGEKAKKWPDYLISDALTANPTGFDGKAFFATDHPTNINDSTVGTQSNYSASGLALTPSNYSTVRARMRAFQGDDGKPMGIIPNLLMVPPALEEAGMNLLNADFIAPSLFGGQSQVGSNYNTLKGSAELLVVNELAGADTTWYLLDTTKAVKPFVFQQRQAPNFVYRNQPTDDNVFWDKEFIFGVDSRGVAGVSLWFLAYKAVA